MCVCIETVYSYFVQHYNECAQWKRNKWPKISEFNNLSLPCSHSLCEWWNFETKTFVNLCLRFSLPLAQIFNSIIRKCCFVFYCFGIAIVFPSNIIIIRRPKRVFAVRTHVYPFRIHNYILLILKHVIVTNNRSNINQMCVTAQIQMDSAQHTHIFTNIYQI